MDFDIGKFRALADKNLLDIEATLRNTEATRALMIKKNGEWFVDSVFNALLDHLNLTHEYCGSVSIDQEERSFHDWPALTNLVKIRLLVLGFDVINLIAKSDVYQFQINIYYELK